MNTTLPKPRTTIINEAEINAILAVARRSDAGRVREVLAKARQMDGLDAEEVAVLMEIQDATLLEEMFAAARFVKDEIYGNRLVLFAPLYVANLCKNECSYCAFRAGNTELKRRTLTQEEIAAEVKILIDQGHKRLLLVSGEEYPADEGFNFILNSIATVYKTKSGRGEIRRVNVNIAPLTVEQFKQLKEAGIGTYQLFQETYHRATYANIHTAGTKKNFDWRVTVMDRAMEAGIDDVGIGVLFGLYDWKFEMLALQQHIRHLEEKFGVGPHTISVPRIEPAVGSQFGGKPAARGFGCRLQKNCRHSAPCRALHRHYHVHPRKRRYAPRDVSTGCVADFGRQPLQSRRLRGTGRRPRRGAVPTRRPPLAGRSRARCRFARLHAFVLHGLLPPGPHRRGFHGFGQAGLDQGTLQPERAVELHGISDGLRLAGNAQWPARNW